MTHSQEIDLALGRNGRLRRIVGIGFPILSLIYLTWRLTTFNPYAYWLSAMFYAAEAIGLILTVTAIMLSWRYRDPAAPPVPRNVTVDVFVLCYKEPVELLRRTLQAAVKIRYAHETWLLDDGNRPEMRALADEIGCRYLARTKNTGAKAGNINNGLAHSRAEFIAVFDSDHIPMPESLERVLGFFDDPGLAMVQTPQDYYNTDAFQYLGDADTGRVWHDQSTFYSINQPCRNDWNAVTGCGTSVLYRRSAIADIGGIPESTVTEDMHTSVKFHKRGWKTLFSNEAIAYGIAATDIGEYYRTRLRWAQGNLHVLRAERIPFAKELSWRQRVAYCALGLIYLEGWQTLFCILVPVLTLTTGLAPFRVTSVNIAMTLGYTLAAILAGRTICCGFRRQWVNEFYAMARFPVHIASWTALFYNRTIFRVSRKNTQGRLQLGMLAPQIAVFVVSLGALALGFYQY